MRISEMWLMQSPLACLHSHLPHQAVRAAMRRLSWVLRGDPWASPFLRRFFASKAAGDLPDSLLPVASAALAAAAATCHMWEGWRSAGPAAAPAPPARPRTQAQARPPTAPPPSFRTRTGGDSRAAQRGQVGALQPAHQAARGAGVQHPRRPRHAGLPGGRRPAGRWVQAHMPVEEAGTWQLFVEILLAQGPRRRASLKFFPHAFCIDPSSRLDSTEGGRGRSPAGH